MSKSDTVSREDIHQLLRLSLELHEQPAERYPRVRHLVNGICRLIGADCVTLIEMVDLGRGDRMPRAAWAVSNCDDDLYYVSVFRQAMTDERVRLPGKGRFFAQGGLVAPRQQLAGRDVWHKSVLWNEYQRSVHLDELAISRRRLPKSGAEIGCTMHRGLRHKPFGRREIQLLAFVLREFGPFLDGIVGAAEDGVVLSLPPQLRRTLERLIAGDSQKQAASALGLSVHTVHEYVQALYRRFDVHSCAELQARFISRSGHGCAPVAAGGRQHEQIGHGIARRPS